MSQSLNTYAIFAVCMLLISAVITPAAHAQGAATETLFKAKCAMCHGADAGGNTPMGKKFNIPDLRAPEIQKKSKAELANAIAKGKNKMPAFEGKMTSDEVNELATYIRQLKK
jgi:mono/diheme cytochrome c family protein